MSRECNIIKGIGFAYKDMENICPWALHGRIEKLENDLKWANKKMQLYEMQIEQDKHRILELERELKEE